MTDERRGAQDDRAQRKKRTKQEEVDKKRKRHTNVQIE